MTMGQAAAQLAEAIGEHVAGVELSSARFHGVLLAAGRPQWPSDTGGALYTGICDGHSATVTNSVAL